MRTKASAKALKRAIEALKALDIPRALRELGISEADLDGRPRRKGGR